MIYEDELNPKIASMMKGMNFMPGMGLGKNQQGPPEFVEPKVPKSKFGLGYQRIGRLRRARRQSSRKKTLWETFMEEGTNYPYAGKPKPLMIADKLVPGFEIFIEEMNEIREPVVKEAVIEELVLSEEPEEVIPAPERKEADDQEGECDFASFVFNNIVDIFYDDIDILVGNLFDTDDLFFSKVNAINSDFAYLCDVLPNGYTVYDDHFMHMFDINSTQTESFN